MGRKQLGELKEYVDLAIGVSKYNEKELLDLGYKNTCVIPISHRVNNLLWYRTTRNKTSPLTLLTVGRLARNKKSKM